MIGIFVRIIADAVDNISSLPIPFNISISNSLNDGDVIGKEKR